MARILVPKIGGTKEWFEQIAPQSFDESDIEMRIILHAPTVYPEYYVYPFKKTVYASEKENDNGRPDLIFIAKDYSDWWICEVELSGHPDAHLENQVRIFTEAKYDIAEAKYLCNKNPNLDFDKVIKLFQDTAARVFVIVNEPKKEWGKMISRYGAMLGVFELFRSQITSEEIFRVNGDYPSRYIRQMSKCTPHPTILKVMAVESPEKLALPKDGIISLIYNNCITEWRRIDVDGQVMIFPIGKPFLETQHQYEIYLQGNDALVLRRAISEDEGEIS